MPSLLSSLWRIERRTQTIACISRRRRPERRLIGLLATAVHHDDLVLLDEAIAAALAWPEETELELTQKALLLFAVTALLAHAHYVERALQVAPLIPLIAGMAQVLSFSTDQPAQSFCWKVAPAYALVQGRSPAYFPIEPLIAPYQQGQVTIDHAYVNQVLLPRRRMPSPILLLPHDLGLVQIGGRSYIILDGNHRVVCAWKQNRYQVPGFVLSPEEEAALFLRYSRWPPYRAGCQ